MDQLTIPIPDGLPDDQKAELEQLLTRVATDYTRQPDGAKRFPIEDDPEFQAEVAEKIRRGMEDVKAGRTRPLEEWKQEVAAKYGLKSDR